MTANKHTPGKWELDEKFNCVDVRAAGGAYIANCNQSVALDWRTKEANARLIASAPELLEALQRLLPHAEHAESCGDSDAYNNADVPTCGCGHDAAIELAIDAIAKATGGAA